MVFTAGDFASVRQARELPGNSQRHAVTARATNKATGLLLTSAGGGLMVCRAYLPARRQQVGCIGIGLAPHVEEG